MKVKISTLKKSLYFTILSLLKNNTNLTNIQKDLHISKQKLNYYLDKLKENHLIERKGYGHYEVKVSIKDTNFSQPKLVRGHAFIWSIKIPQEIKDWDKRIEILKKNNIDFKLVGISKETPRIWINKKKVWLGNKTITIFENCSFYAKNSINSRKFAVITMIETLDKLESKLKINLHPYIFHPAREHFGLIKNDLAIQCNRNKEKLHIKDNGTEWLWIDDSESLGELETGSKEALVRNIQVQNWWNDNKKHNFELTSSKILEMINGVTQNQLMNAANIEKHQKVLDEMLTTLKLIQEKL